MTDRSRPMSAGEKYFAFLDRVVPMTMLFVADLDTVVGPALVERAWPEFSARRAVTRLRVHDDLTISDGPPSRHVVTAAVPEAGWDAVLGEVARDPIGADEPMRCRYLHDPATGRSRVVLAVHHALVDGRVCVVELQQFLRHLDGRPVPEHDELTVAAEPSGDWPWQHDPRARVQLLRDVAERARRDGEVHPRGWTRPTAPRDPHFVSLPLDPARSRALLDAARAHGTSAYPATAAAWLVAVAGRLGEGAAPLFQLATPADLRDPSVASGPPTGPVVSVIATRHAVGADPWQLAPAIADAIAGVRSRGEDTLFFHLTGAGRIGDIDAGAAAVARNLASTPPSVSVTNIGVVDAAEDPEWVASVCGYLPASPNNVLFVSGAGYRGRFVQSIAFDGGQLPPATAAAIVADYRAIVDGMTG